MVGKQLLVGAIAGDVIGSVYEFNNTKSKEFPLFSKRSRFTDDTVLTIATADKFLNHLSYEEAYLEYAREYPNSGYGCRFRGWMYSENPKPYNSFGNGSAMRVSPVAYTCNTIEDVLEEAKRSAEVTHNHDEGVKGAQSVAAAIFLARSGESKDKIKKYIQDNFGYDLERTVDSIREYYEFDVTCQGSVPEAIIAFLESADFEDAIRLAISLGGDSDTIACITGSIAEAFYGEIPQHIINEVITRLPDKFIEVLNGFNFKYGKG